MLHVLSEHGTMYLQNMIGEVMPVRLREIRESKGIGLNELAKQCNISPSYLSALERGVKKNPTKEIMDRIAEVLSEPVKNIFYT